MNTEGMKQQLDKLVELQSVTSETVKICEILAGVEEITMALDNRIEISTAQLEEQKALTTELKARYRELETEIHTTETHIKKISEKRISVKTNREYKALLKEEDQLKRHQSKMEDQMLAMLDEIENAEKAVVDIETTLAEVERQVAEEKASIAGEAAKNREQLNGLNGLLENISKNIEPKLLSTFMAVKGKQAKGIVMVPVRDANCGGCNVNIPPQMYNELQRCDSIRFCPNCQRILYWQPAGEVNES